MLQSISRFLILFLALLPIPSFAQVRFKADARATVNLGALASGPPGRAGAKPIRREVYEPQPTRPRNSGAASIRTRASEIPPPTTANVTPTFTGFQALLDNFTSFPPDTEGAVGPHDVVTMLNTEVLIQSRTGVARGNPVSLNSFWSPLGSFSDTFDPRILYDAADDRWIASAAVFGNSASSALLLGVSQTGDPGGTWNLYQININPSGTPSTSANWCDYPVLGFNGNWVVISVNLFRVSSKGDGNYVNTSLYVFGKSQLLRGTDSFITISDDQGEPFIPAVDFDNHPNTMYLLQTFAGDVGYRDGFGTIRISKLEGAVGSESFVPGNGGTITINDPWADAGTFSGADFAPQLGTTTKIDTGDSRLQNCVMRGGTIWCSQTVFLPLASPARSAVQWFQIDPAGKTLLQLGRIDDPTATYFYAYPSLAVNKNIDMLIGYNRFSASDYASAEFSFRLASDPPNTLEPDVLFRPGEAAYVAIGSRSGSNRWGDFSTTWVDPADDLTFWTIQEYAVQPPSRMSGQFGTWWAEVTAPSAGTTAPQPQFPARGLVNAASYTGGGVAPGEVITIFGNNLGPGTGQQPTVSPSGVVGRVAGGTSVLFDGAAAPMVYAVAGQVSAVVPFGLQGHASTQVQVSYLGTVSNPITVPVVGSAPGIFTLNQQGFGPGAIRNNADSTVNGPDHPAARGSVIQIYATGGGAMLGAPVDGTLAQPPLPVINQPVTARVGGLPAQVLYQGSALGLLNGAVQINVVVPFNVAPGSSVPVDITVGGVTSAQGVTIVVQ